MAKRRDSGIPCSVEGCAGTHYARGYCNRHYQRVRIDGVSGPVGRKPKRICSVPGCGELMKGRDLCAMHYQRSQRGEVGGAAQQKATPGEKTLLKCGAHQCPGAEKLWHHLNYVRNKPFLVGRIIARRKVRYAEDMSFNLAVRVRARVRMALTARLDGIPKSASTAELLGCSYDQLRIHIERQFTRGMTWEAFAQGLIHVDHIQPCAGFDLTDPAEQRACFHFSNLRPLWGPDNLAKRDHRTLLL